MLWSLTVHIHVIAGLIFVCLFNWDSFAVNYSFHHLLSLNIVKAILILHLNNLIGLLAFDDSGFMWLPKSYAWDDPITNQWIITKTIDQIVLMDSFDKIVSIIFIVINIKLETYHCQIFNWTILHRNCFQLLFPSYIWKFINHLTDSYLLTIKLTYMPISSSLLLWE